MRVSQVARLSSQKYNVWVHIQDQGAGKVQPSPVTNRRDAVPFCFAFGAKEGRLGGLGRWGSGFSVEFKVDQDTLIRCTHTAPRPYRTPCPSLQGL